MKILVIGKGGREHALVWKIAQSDLVKKIFCVPGNPGIAEIAECHDVQIGGDFSEIIDFAIEKQIDLTVIGPEEPLANGIVSAFSARDLRAFGPDLNAAILEASKDFAKNLMIENNIPTAKHRTFENAEIAIDYLKKLNSPVFVKADGLATGKGAIPGPTLDEAISAVKRILIDRDFGNAGQKVVIEEFMIGEEASFTVLTDGDHCLPLATSQDHKMSHDGDTGNNTGGMGAYSPAPVMTADLIDRVMAEIVRPTIRAMKNLGRTYKGVLYVGLMVTDQGPKVVEFNCRFGDPEAQVLFPRLTSDLVPLLNACIDGELDQHDAKWRSDPAVCVAMSSGGYPKRYEKGKEIRGVDQANAIKNVTVFHAGTAIKNEKLITDGGRVLGVTAIGENIRLAIDQSYRGVSEIDFENSHYRSDIAHRAIERVLKNQ